MELTLVVFSPEGDPTPIGMTANVDNELELDLFCHSLRMLDMMIELGGVGSYTILEGGPTSEMFRLDAGQR